MLSQNLFSNQCISKDNFSTRIKNKDDHMSHLSLIYNNKVIYEMDIVRPDDIKNIIKFKDMDFDGVDELLVDTTIIARNQTFAIFKIDCNNLIEFYPSEILNFKLNKQNKTLNEHTRGEDGFKPRVNTYCIKNKKYYLCKRKDYINKDIDKFTIFNQDEKKEEVYYSFENKRINLSKRNLVTYNNIAYYLEKEGNYKESALLLEKIISKYPDRTVAYINLGDAYWGMNEKAKAKIAYETYIKQMKVNCKENRIPKKVLERVK